MSTTALRLIARNIAEFGHHVYLVSGGTSPRYAYTIGLSESLGAELVFAGGIIYDADEAKRIIGELVARLRDGATFEMALQIEGLGSFTFRSARDAWVRMLMLGALDYYRGRHVKAYQVLPDQEHWTIDVPNLENPWSVTSEPVWRWLYEEWPYPVPQDSVATTNLDALRGLRVTEAARWEDDQWELFVGSGPDVEPQDVRVVPLGVLLGADESLSAVTELRIGKALWRDAEQGEWHPWGTADTDPE